MKSNTRYTSRDHQLQNHTTMQSFGNNIPSASSASSSSSCLPPLNLRKAKNWFIRSKTEFAKRETDSEFVIARPLIEQNWLIPGHLMIGGYPASYTGNISESNEILKALVQVEGIDTFVCLNQEYGRNKIHPAYADDTTDSCFGKNNIKAYNPIFDKSKNFVHLPIPDMSIAEKSKVKALCENIIQRLQSGERIYLHCSGGHGRSGTIAAIVLCMIYKINPETAFEYIQYVHDQRIRRKFGDGSYSVLLIGVDRFLRKALQPGQVPTPQASIQRNQVREIVNSFA
jgi:hypothetical protein